eukprot:828035-Pelagomonas_calceolata.AAC.6
MDSPQLGCYALESSSDFQSCAPGSTWKYVQGGGSCLEALGAHSRADNCIECPKGNEPFASEVEDEANNHFQKIYSQEEPIEEVGGRTISVNWSVNGLLNRSEEERLPTCRQELQRPLCRIMLTKIKMPMKGGRASECAIHRAASCSMCMYFTCDAVKHRHCPCQGAGCVPTSVVQLLQSFKASNNAHEQEVFACMIHNLFDEYRFFPRYPDKVRPIALPPPPKHLRPTFSPCTHALPAQPTPVCAMPVLYWQQRQASHHHIALWASMWVMIAWNM